jgi:hypothetical protein
MISFVLSNKKVIIMKQFFIKTIPCKNGILNFDEQDFRRQVPNGYRADIAPVQLTFHDTFAVAAVEIMPQAPPLTDTSITIGSRQRNPRTSY